MLLQKKRACESPGTHSHIFMTGEGQKWFFWVYERRRIFWGREKKRDFFGLQKKELGIFLGYARKSSDFFWVDKFWSCDFLGYKS